MYGSVRLWENKRFPWVLRGRLLSEVITHILI
jgi:hypothetical protein